MKFSALSKLVSYLLAALGLLSLSFGGELSPLSLACLFVGFVASYFVEGKLLGSAGWSRGITVALVALLAVQALRGFAGQAPWLSLAMELAGWLTISRLANRRTAQDHQQVAMLAFIQLIAATVLTTDLAYAGLFLAFVVVTPWALTLAHLRAEIERNYPVETELRGGTDLSRVLSSRRILGPRFLLWTSLLSIPMLLMTLLLFVAFPRVGLGFIGRNSQRGQHVAGFGNTVSLGGFGLIRDDPSVVVRVSVGRELTVGEQAQVLRLRGTAFDHYDGRTWTRSQGEPVHMSPIIDYYPLRRVQRRSDLVLKMVLERLDTPVLFLPSGTIGLRIPLRGIPGVARSQVTLLRSHGLDVRYRSGDELGLVYDAVVSSDPADNDLPVARDTDDDRYLQMPAGHERLITLAKRLAGTLTDPLAIIRRFETHLRDNDRYKYSLNQPDTHGKQPLEVFLFEAKRGHCEYFASALAIMLRAVGIPSRNVTGFYGGEYNPYGGYYGLRQSDAHSWVEALTPDRGWVTVDPTPAGGARSMHRSLFAAANAMMDAMRNYWMTRVVGYDLRTQISALRSLSAMWRKVSFPKLSFAGSEQKSEGHSGPSSAAVPLALGVAASLMMLGVALWAVLRMRRKQMKRTLGPSALTAQRLYRQLERVLEKRGRARPEHVTANEHAQQLASDGFVAAEAVRELTASYVQARYGQLELSPVRVKQLRKLLAEVKRAA